MNISKHHSTTLLFSIVLSLMLHSLLVAGMLRAAGFDFPGSLSDRTLFVQITSDRPHKPGLATSVKRSATKVGQIKAAAIRGDATHEEEDANAKEGSADRHGEDLDDSSATATEDAVATSTEEAAEKEPDGLPVKDSLAAADGVPVPDTPRESAPPLLKGTRERLSFEIYWLGIYVGKAVLEAVNRNGTVSITSRVLSSSFISTFYRVDDYAESIVRDGTPVNFRIRQREGKYRSDKESVFDLSGNKVTFANYLKGTRDERALPPGTVWDIISGFYHLRNQPLEVGQTVSVALFDSNKFYTAEVSVLKKEQVELPEVGEIDTVKVKPILKSEGLFQNKGDVLIWLTDDENKVPVKIETKVPIGNVVVLLKTIEREQ